MVTERTQSIRLDARLMLALATTLAPCSCSSSPAGTTGFGATGSEGSSDQTTHEEGTTALTESPSVESSSTFGGGMDATSIMPTMDSSTSNAESTTGEASVCGNGVVEDGEACDDGVNDGSYGGCSVDCQSLAPRCGDGDVDAQEACDDANQGSADGCLSDCSVPASCMDIRLHDRTATSGIHEIDSDGPGGYGAYEAYCDMDHAGGGWTLVIVSADDGHETWTWLNRELMTTDTHLVGNVEVLDEDFKSPALHLVGFSDLLFIHEPSSIWASYDGVGDGSDDVGTFMSGLPFPQCDLTSGFPMTDGELTQLGTNLCNTNLYFHTGDHDGLPDQAYCEAFAAPAYDATYGPVWNAANNAGCPMDDPPSSGLGPQRLANYDILSPQGIEDVELDGRGFAFGMGLMQVADSFQMYVR